MDLGVWMSAAVWRKKAEADGRRQTWSLRALPEGFGTRPGPVRLYVATRGQWRGRFTLEAWSWNPADAEAPVTLIFDPCTWTEIEPCPAPRRPVGQDFTLQTPVVSADSPQRGNEIDSGDSARHRTR